MSRKSLPNWLKCSMFSFSCCLGFFRDFKLPLELHTLYFPMGSLPDPPPDIQVHASRLRKSRQALEQVNAYRVLRLRISIYFVSQKTLCM